MPTLSCVAGEHRFAVKLQPADRLETTRERIAKKLKLSEDDFGISYEWTDVLYQLDDSEDFDLMLERFEDAREIKIVCAGPSIQTPTAPPGPGHRVPESSKSGDHPGAFTGQDAASTYAASTAWSAPLGTVKPKPTNSVHLIASSASSKGSDAASVSTSKTFQTVKTTAPSLHAHVDAFTDFQNSRGVRTFVGSIGPVENVRMMMKSGHRQCYMSRAFAQQHNFIPKDAAPGFYGFSGITNLGSWPIKVGSKTVEQQVMLIEQALFPVTLGRSFMEKRKVNFDQLDQTFVCFGDTGEFVPTDVVVVKDASGSAVPIP